LININILKKNNNNNNKLNIINLSRNINIKSIKFYKNITNKLLKCITLNKLLTVEEAKELSIPISSKNYKNNSNITNKSTNKNSSSPNVPSLVPVNSFVMTTNLPILPNNTPNKMIKKP
jgi:hypothetical protein